MAGLRVFVSSTCYDLSVIRSQLRGFIQSLGHEPFMSEYGDLLYDPRTHTHTSCVDEVNSADVVVLIVGSRLGGSAIDEAISKVNFDELEKRVNNKDFFEKKENLTITQLEILKALQIGIPVYTFIDAPVWHDHSLYEKNKANKDIIDKIEFPSIQKPNTASFIFNFINFLRKRATGNSVHSFSQPQDIERILRKQWSSLFQKLIQEQRNNQSEQKRIDGLTDQFEDLRAAILTSIGNSNEKAVARGVVRFRRLVDFVRSLQIPEEKFLFKGKNSWDNLLQTMGVEKVLSMSDLHEKGIYLNDTRLYRPRLFLVKSDNTFFQCRLSKDAFDNLSLEWNAFMELAEDTREIIYDALNDMRQTMNLTRYITEDFDGYIKRNYLPPDEGNEGCG